MTLDEHIRQLRLIKTQFNAQVDALLDSLEGAKPKQGAVTDEEGNCLHPPDARELMPAMGKNKNRFLCRLCREIGGVE